MQTVMVVINPHRFNFGEEGHYPSPKKVSAFLGAIEDVMSRKFRDMGRNWEVKATASLATFSASVKETGAEQLSAIREIAKRAPFCAILDGRMAWDKERRDLLRVAHKAMPRSEG